MQSLFNWAEQPMGNVPARARPLELDGLSGPFRPKPFHDSMKCSLLCGRESAKGQIVAPQPGAGHDKGVR